MSGLSALLALGMPFAMVFGAIAAWRISKREQHDESAPPAWRDDSLDEWRRERDATAEAERAARATLPGKRGREIEETAEAAPHQRIGR
ncbi:MAG: hypothetical protein HUU14_03970 [Dehalococcoidia bacterium]|nr:MAG: hypothetical protein EDM76_05835 [bacterium]MCK6565398.1 hypothetical protein [Dehalococcoidia bacterium]MCL4232847.1 hypothetical protein [Dehalococcoidia bacterium]NUQ55025.1 hypothetical protein [Dehalococcoidia bacterium]